MKIQVRLCEQNRSFIFTFVHAAACNTKIDDPPDFFSGIGCTENTVKNKGVLVAGAMRNVMQKGDLQSTISIDTIANKEHLFGLGPLEYLTGEALIVDGYAYLSKVSPDSSMKVEENINFNSPFFVYMNVNEWSAATIPDSVKTLQQIEKFLEVISVSQEGPFAFRLMGFIDEAVIHVVNLPPGTEVHSPQDAHLGKVSYNLSDEPVEVIGFFSKKHQSIFTHHGSFTHMHLITDDKTKMGHLDAIKLQSGLAQLWVSFKI